MFIVRNLIITLLIADTYLFLSIYSAILFYSIRYRQDYSILQDIDIILIYGIKIGFCVSVYLPKIRDLYDDQVPVIPYKCPNRLKVLAYDKHVFYLSIHIWRDINIFLSIVFFYRIQIGLLTKKELYSLSDRLAALVILKASLKPLSTTEL